jgi:alpha-beta hydrolase superfamily lysophospholipase
MKRLNATLTGLALTGLVLAGLSACAPFQQVALPGEMTPPAGFSDHWFTSFDGARLGLDVYSPPAEGAGAGPCEADGEVNLATDASACAAAGAVYGVEPDVVIVAVHGMNDYAGAFHAAGEWWSRQGAAVYAYDQRGFGRSPGWMLWPEPELMRRDLETAVAVARGRHPDAKIAVVGESMGASVAITAFAGPAPPDADALVLSGPGFRGWGVLPWFYSVSLWLSSHVRPDWIVVPPEGVTIVATDNDAKLREMWSDPHVQKANRIDSVYGVVSLMEEADQKIDRIPTALPTLMLYGAKDEIIPPDGVARAAQRMPRHVKTAYYAKGYHMLMNDLQAETVWRDVLAFIRHPNEALPSKPPAIPFGRETAENR